MPHSVPQDEMSPVRADTSVWIAHFRQGESFLAKLLEEEVVVCHPFIIGEQACGTLNNRQGILSLLQSLPPAPPAESGEVLRLIDLKGLMGQGLGWVDGYLLASARLAEAQLWTLDKALRKASRRLEILCR